MLAGGMVSGAADGHGLLTRIAPAYVDNSKWVAVPGVTDYRPVRARGSSGHSPGGSRRRLMTLTPSGPSPFGAIPSGPSPQASGPSGKLTRRLISAWSAPARKDRQIRSDKSAL